MQFSANQAELLKAIQATAKGVTGRSVQPVQGNILIEATDDNRLTLTATDLEYIGVESVIQAQVSDPGSTTISAKFFSEITGAMNGGEVVFKTDGNKATITCGKSKYNCVTLNAEDFSKLPAIENAITFTLEASVLHDALSKVLFATSRDQTRPVLTGALLTAVGSDLRLVATDTYRLSMKDVDGVFAEATELNAIISRTALAELMRSTSNVQAEVEISISGTLAQFVIGNVTITTRLIEGQFVNYSKVIPTDPPISVKCSSDALTTALGRAMPVARDDANRVIFKSDDGCLRLHTHAQDVGEYDDQVDATLTEGVVETAFNAAYLNEFLNTVDGDVNMLFAENPLASALMRPVADSGHTFVIMPMQVM